ncbi:uncharacterized protein LOC144127796 [Amblyomma americanum]
MAYWQNPAFDPPLPAFRPQDVGGWFAQFETALYLNGITIQPFKHAALCDILPSDLLRRLVCPALGCRPYDEQSAAILADFGVSYRPLTVYDSADPLSPPPAAGAATASLSPTPPSPQHCPPRQPLSASTPLQLSISGPADHRHDSRGRLTIRFAATPTPTPAFSASLNAPHCSSAHPEIHSAQSPPPRPPLPFLPKPPDTKDHSVPVCESRFSAPPSGSAQQASAALSQPRPADSHELSAKPQHSLRPCKGPQRSKHPMKQDEKAKQVTAAQSMVIVTRLILPNNDAEPLPVVPPPLGIPTAPAFLTAPVLSAASAHPAPPAILAVSALPAAQTLPAASPLQAPPVATASPASSYVYGSAPVARAPLVRPPITFKPIAPRLAVSVSQQPRAVQHSHSPAWNLAAPAVASPMGTGQLGRASSALISRPEAHLAPSAVPPLLGRPSAAAPEPPALGVLRRLINLIHLPLRVPRRPPKVRPQRHSQSRPPEPRLRTPAGLHDSSLIPTDRLGGEPCSAPRGWQCA